MLKLFTKKKCNALFIVSALLCFPFATVVWMPLKCGNQKCTQVAPKLCFNLVQ